MSISKKNILQPLTVWIGQMELNFLKSWKMKIQGLLSKLAMVKQELNLWEYSWMKEWLDTYNTNPKEPKKH